MERRRPQPLVASRPKWEPSWQWNCSLEDFPEFDPEATLGSPRSLAACDAEGILQQELRYKPPERYQLPGIDSRIAQLRYDFMENRRQDQLAAARNARLAIIDLEQDFQRSAAGGTPSSKRAGRVPDLDASLQLSWQEGGPPDPQLAGPHTTPYPEALSFFKQVLDEYSSMKAASPPESPKHSPSASTEVSVTFPVISPTSSHKRPDTTNSVVRSASESEIRGILERVRSAPRASLVDENMARASMDIHIVYPTLEKKWRKQDFKTERSLLHSRAGMAANCFERLVIDDYMKNEQKLLRDVAHLSSAEADPTSPMSRSGANS
ncbi:unnamed protein product, partial [Polarella glacialis]